MDYSIFATEHTLSETRNVNDIILEQMERELTFIMTCLESTIINIGDLEVVQETFADSVRNIIQAIINFFKRLFGDYRASSEKKVSEFTKWHNDNKDKLKNIDHASIDVAMPPYWNGDKSLDSGLAIIDGIREGHLHAFLPTTAGMKDLNLKNLADEKTFITSDSKIQPLVNKEDNLTEGAKNYFMFGNADNIPPNEKLSGKDIMEKVKMMTDYCSTYDNVVVKKLDDEASRTNKSIEKIQAQLKTTAPATTTTTTNTTAPKTPVAASAYMINDISILRNCINYEKVYEAGEAAPKTAPIQPANSTPAPHPTTTATEKPADTGKPGKIEITDKTNKDEVADHTENKRMSQYDHTQLQALNVLFGIMKKVIAAAMSAQEKKFVDYFSVLKSLSTKEIKEPTKKEAEKTEPEKKNEAGTPATSSGKAFSGEPTK